MQLTLGVFSRTRHPEGGRPSPVQRGPVMRAGLGCPLAANIGCQDSELLVLGHVTLVE